jgi:hypothetical protein
MVIRTLTSGLLPLSVCVNVQAGVLVSAHTGTTEMSKSVSVRMCVSQSLGHSQKPIQPSEK